MRRRLRTPLGRLLVATATVALAAVMLVDIARAEPGDGISATGATVDKVGWWYKQNEAVEGPTGNITVPPPPGTSATTLAVGAINGEADKLAAVGILPEATTGDSITAFTLTIKEAGPPSGNVNSSAAQIVACPITAFWVGGGNGTWKDQPKFDCGLAEAPGTRGADGTWTFDLLAIGQAWVDPSGSIAPDGVVLVEKVDSPTGFQTVFTTEGEGALVVSLSFEPGSPSDDPFGGGFDDSGGTGSFDSGSGSFDTPSFGSSDIPVGGLPTPAPDAAGGPATTAPATSAPPRTIASTSPNILGNLPGGLVLAVPLFLVLLGLLSYSLGPAGEPAAATRQRGVSRALAARAAHSPTSLETS